MLQTQLLSSIFVGRERELEALTELLANAAAGSGSVVLIGGDAGIGKTRLCRELKSRAVRRNVRVIEGRCSAAEAGVPYGPFMDALRFRLARGEVSEAAEALEPVFGQLAPLFVELARMIGGETSGRPPVALARPFEPILTAIRRYLGRGPALLLLEDFHWADPTSRELLHFLAQRIEHEPLLIVATYQTDEIPVRHPIHCLAAGLMRDRAAHRIQLEPFREEEVNSMLSAMLDSEPEPEFVRSVQERTEGNPLFIEELVSAIAQSRSDRAPRLTAEDLEGIKPPATIREIVLGRIQPLGEEARQALEMASVAGRRFRFDVLADALGWSEDQLLQAVEPAVSHRVLVEEPGGGGEHLLFRHSLVQEVIYGSILRRRRQIWHARVEAALSARSGRPSAGETARRLMAPAPLDRLTSREAQVLEVLSEGKTNKQIARALSIRPKTVGNHVSRILAKLECSTRTEASRLVLAARFGRAPASDAA